MILIAGASGMVGRDVCRLLREQDIPVRALVRRTTDPARIERLQSMGAELVVGDVRDPGSLARACEGAGAVVSAVASYQSQQPGDTMQTVEQEGQINLIDAARAAGVEHFIPSTYGINPEILEAEAPLVEAKAAAERYLIDGGVAYTILYTGFFMESWLSPSMGFDAANAKARFYGSGSNPLSWISMRDVAQVVVACLRSPHFRNRVLNVGGEALTPLEVVGIFEEETGRSFEVEFVPEEALRDTDTTSRDPLEQTTMAFLHQYARGHVIDQNGLKRELSLQFTTVREYARRFVGEVLDAGQTAVPPAS